MRGLIVNSSDTKFDDSTHLLLKALVHVSGAVRIPNVQVLVWYMVAPQARQPSGGIPPRTFLKSGGPEHDFQHSTQQILGKNSIEIAKLIPWLDKKCGFSVLSFTISILIKVRRVIFLLSNQLIQLVLLFNISRYKSPKYHCLVCLEKHVYNSIQN